MTVENNQLDFNSDGVTYSFGNSTYSPGGQSRDFGLSHRTSLTHNDVGETHRAGHQHDQLHSHSGLAGASTSDSTDATATTAQADDASHLGTTETVSDASVDHTADADASHVMDATTTAPASGSTDATATTAQADDASHLGTTETVSDASVAASGELHWPLQNLFDDAFAFPAHSTSTAEYGSGGAPDLPSTTHTSESWSGLGGELSEFVRDLQAYVSEHHVTAADAHELVDNIHAAIANGMDLHL